LFTLSHDLGLATNLLNYLSGKWVVVQAIKRTRITVLDTDGRRILCVRPDHIRKVARD